MYKFSVTICSREYYKYKFEFRKLEPRGGFYRKTVIPIPFTKKAIYLYEDVRSYAEAIGFKYSIDWVLDEFDDVFNELAIASMKYHLNYSHVLISGKLRTTMEQLIKDLDPIFPITEDDLKEEEHLNSMKEMNMAEAFKHYKECPICSEYHEKQQKIMDEKHQLELDARHRFVDIMGSLWS